MLARLFAVTTINIADRSTLSIAGADIRKAFDFSRMQMGCIFSAFALLSIVVRPHSNDGGVVKRLPDIGFFNVIFPCVQSAGEARRAEASTRYPPDGTRGVAVAHRSSRYGTVENHLDLVNDNITVIVQIESRYMDMGAPIVAVGSDLGVFRAGTKALREQFKRDGTLEARA